MPIIEELSDEEPAAAEGEEGGERRAWRERFAAMEAEERERVARQFALGEEMRAAGNAAMAQGDHEAALRSYKQALQELTMVGNEPENRARAEEATKALHLNLALACLKMQRYAEVKEHTASVLVADPASVKALYRRGVAEASLARAAVLFQEGEARAAIADFEALLAVDPENAEAKRELQRIRAELRTHERDLAQKQRDTWGQVFGGRTVLEGEEDAPPDAPLPAVRPRPCRGAGEKHLILSLEGASAAAALADVDLELREGWCVGVCGASAAARAALVGLVMGTASPSAGSVVVHPKPPKPGRKKQEAKPIDRRMLGGAAAVVVAMVVATELADVVAAQRWAMRLVAVMAFGLLRVMWAVTGPEELRVHAELAAAGAEVPNATVEELLGSRLARQLKAEERRARVLAMLRASGFEGDGGNGDVAQRCVEQRQRYRDLPEDQRLVVQALRCIAARPEVLVVDGALDGLPLAARARLLRMLKRMKQECKTSVVLLSGDLGQVGYLADTICVLSAEGALCERGPAAEVLETPRHEETRALLAAGADVKAAGGLLSAKCQELLSDAALEGPWLPPKYT